MIPLFKVHMNDKAKEYVQATLESGYIGQGKQVDRFEQALAETFKFGPILTVNSCTFAIELALHMIGIKPGDEVITTPQTCTATNSPIVNKFARIIWADIDPYTGLIDPQDVARKITDKTKAIIAVNWGGFMPDYTALKQHGIPVIEDAAHGPYWSDKERGNYIVWSFQAIKHLTTGDGGAIYCDDPARAKLLRWYGLDRESKADFRCSQDIVEIGYKGHMNDIAASIGLANITDLETLVTLHNRNAQYYDTHIRNHVRKPVYTPDNPFWLYTIQTRDRDQFIEYLKDNGIAASQVHARNDKHTAFKENAGTPFLAGVGYFDTYQVSIPVGWWLDQNDLDHIVSTVNKWEKYI